jgi:hypothetical protein
VAMCVLTDGVEAFRSFKIEEINST